MKTAAAMVYTKKAASVLLGIPAEQIKKMDLSNKEYVLISVKGSTTRIRVKRFYFTKKFVSDRKERATLLVAERNSDTTFTVHNLEKKTNYSVYLAPNAVRCTCKDYQNQQDAGLNGACKHSYAVLNLMGLGSLKEYQELQANIKKDSIESTRWALV